MRVVIPGGSGQVGTLLARRMHGNRHHVTVLSRSPRPAPWEVHPWDGRTVGDWLTAIDGSDVVINLAGKSVDCRYTGANRREILESRVASTRAVGAAIARCGTPPRVWLQAATATIYPHTIGPPRDESATVSSGNAEGAPPSWKFSVEVALAWERALAAADTPHTRKVALRSAMTMSPDRGGVFDVLLRLVRLGVGGAMGDGRQYVSWIHEDDFARAVDRMIESDDLAGPVNVSAPGALTNGEFMAELRGAWGRSFGLPSPRWLLEVGAVVMRTETELVLKSRRVAPRRLLEHGFEFAFPAWPEAARDLCAAVRDRQRGAHGR